MAHFPNIVANPDGVALAGFISSIDARAYAENTSCYAEYLTVTDWAGFVTEHRKGQPVRIIREGQGDPAIVSGARKNITDHFNVAEQVSA